MTVFTLLTGIVMELSRWRVWSVWFPAFAPHYTEDSQVSEALANELDSLNTAKSVIYGYVVIIGLLLRVGHYIVMPLLCLVGFPCLLCSYKNSK